MTAPRSRAIIAAAMVFAAAPPAATLLAAQAREVQRHSVAEPEGRLMGFYSAALAFTGGLSTLRLTNRGIAAALEIGYIPPLSAAQRTAGFDKPEASNLAPFFPRPRVVIALPAGLRVEGSWVPPVRLFDASASLISVAVSGAFPVGRAIELGPRVSWLDGRVRGAITCSDGLADGTHADRVYYANVCHGRPSDDFFQPRHVSLELIATRTSDGTRVRPFVGAGLRGERTRFDIGVLHADGSRDRDHPILEMRGTRAFAIAGAGWTIAERLTGAGEVLVAPGALVTLRLYSALALR